MSSEQFAVLVLLRMKNKPAKKMSNKYGLSIDPLCTPNVVGSHSLYELFILVLFFHVKNNHKLVLKQAS